MFKITIYETEDGKIPMREFLVGLDKQAFEAVGIAVEKLKREGNLLREPDSKQIERNLFELRIKERSNAHRLIYFFIVGHEIIITNGFTKKTQKTPEREIELAKKYRADFLRRR